MLFKVTLILLLNAPIKTLIKVLFETFFSNLENKAFLRKNISNKNCKVLNGALSSNVSMILNSIKVT